MPHGFTSVIIIMNIQSNILVLKFFQQSVFAATKGSKHLFSAIFFSFSCFCMTLKTVDMPNLVIFMRSSQSNEMWGKGGGAEKLVSELKNCVTAQ